jgi:phosphate transport system permease protein
MNLNNSVFDSKRGHRLRMKIEGRIVNLFVSICAFITLLVTFAIIWNLVQQSIGFFTQVSLIDFFTETRWSPILIPKSFGIAPLVAGTFLVTIIASFVAVPVGLSVAIYLAEYAPDTLRRILKPIIEVLAGIPTVVYGYFALTFVTPLLKIVFPEMIIFNALSAGLVMGIMIIPFVSSLTEDALIAVPNSLRQASYALGATRFETSIKVVVPAALSGIIAAFVLGLSRAIGETMLVTIAAGATPKLTFNPIESIQTMTAYIVQLALGEAANGSIEYQSIYAVGILLFLITFSMNTLGHWIVRRWRNVY